MKHMKTMNDALLMKLAWGLITDSDALWVQVLKRKYGAGVELMLDIKLGSRPSPIWRGICKIWPTFISGTRWVIGDGSKAKFWEDRWIGEESPLKEKATCSILKDIRHARVRDLVSKSGG